MAKEEENLVSRLECVCSAEEDGDWEVWNLGQCKSVGQQHRGVHSGEDWKEEKKWWEFIYLNCQVKHYNLGSSKG